MGKGVGKMLNLDEPNGSLATKNELPIITINTKNASTTPREKLSKITSFHDHYNCLRKEIRKCLKIFL